MDLDNFTNDENEQADELEAENEAENEEQQAQSSQEQGQEQSQEQETEESGTPPVAESTQVPLPALQEERAKRQALQEENERLKKQMEGTASEGGSEEAQGGPKAAKNLDPNDPDPYDALDPDDIPTVEQQKEHEGWAQRETNRKQKFVQHQHYSSLEAEARQRLSTETMGEHRDYDSVVKTGNAWLTPSDVRSVHSDPDPPKRLYDLCIERCPYFSADTAAGKTLESSTQKAKGEQETVATSTPSEKPIQAKAPSLTKTFSEDDELGNLVSSFIGNDEGEE